MDNRKPVRMHFPFEFTASGLKDLSLEDTIAFMRAQIEHDVKCENWEMANDELEIALKHSPAIEGAKGYAIADVLIFQE